MTNEELELSELQIMCLENANEARRLQFDNDVLRARIAALEAAQSEEPIPWDRIESGPYLCWKGTKRQLEVLYFPGPPIKTDIRWCEELKIIPYRKLTPPALATKDGEWLCAGKCGTWHSGEPAAHNGSGPVCEQCEDEHGPN